MRSSAGVRPVVLHADEYPVYAEYRYAEIAKEPGVRSTRPHDRNDGHGRPERTGHPLDDFEHIVPHRGLRAHVDGSNALDRRILPDERTDRLFDAIG